MIKFKDQTVLIYIFDSRFRSSAPIDYLKILNLCRAYNNYFELVGTGGDVMMYTFSSIFER